MEDKQIITIADGKIITINNVKEILGFDENTVVLSSVNGKITVEGVDLKIESLEKNDGKLVVKGEITGVFSSEGECEKKGFLSRLFSK